MIGIGCKDLGGTHGVVQVVNRLQEMGHLPQIFCNGIGRTALTAAGLRFMECEDPLEVLGQFQPSVWISTMDEPGSIGASVARHLIDTPTKVIALTDYPTSSALIDPEWSGWRPDLITAGDEVNARIIARAWPDYNPARIIVTGYPAFDRFEAVDVAGTWVEVRHRLGIPLEAFLAVLFTNTDDTSELTREFIKVMPLDALAYFAVRPHPRLHERSTSIFAELQELLKPYFELGNCVDSSNISTTDVICAADVVVSPCSTVSGEAAMLRVPSINIYLPFVEEWYQDAIGGLAARFPWSENGVCAEAWTGAELEELLMAARSGDLRKRLEPIQETFFPHGGRSSRKVAELIVNTQEQ